MYVCMHAYKDCNKGIPAHEEHVLKVVTEALHAALCIRRTD